MNARIAGWNAVFVCCAFAAVASGQTPIVDQSYSPAQPDQGIGIRDLAFYRGQSFTIGQSGWLTQVALFLNSCSSANDSPIVIRLRAGTLASGPVLAEGTIAPTEVPYTGGCGAGAGVTATFVEAPLNAAARVAAGQTYTIWAHSADQTDEYAWWGDPADAYAGGTALTNAIVFGFDLGFRTVVLATASDQTYQPGSPSQGLGIRSTAFYRGQTFTAGQSGWLTDVSLLLNSCSAANDSAIVVRVRAGDSAGGPVIGETSIPAAAVPFSGGCGAGSGVSATFAAASLHLAARLDAGQVYSLWAHSADHTDEYGWWGDPGDAYAGGGALTNGIAMGFDVGFSTRMLPFSADPAYVPTSPDQGIGIQSVAFYRGQSFTATTSGWLTHVALLLNSCSGSNDASISVRLRAGTNANDAVLAQATIPPATVRFAGGCGAGSGVNATFTGAVFDRAVVVAPGQVYTIWADSSDQTDEYGWWGDPIDAYAGGTAFSGGFAFSFDVGFEAHVWPTPPNTPPGISVPVELSTNLPGGGSTTVELTFDNVATGGDTTVTTASTGVPPPQGFKLIDPPVYYDISTTSTFTGGIRLCLRWVEGQVLNEANVRLFHFEGAPGAWVDVTDLTSIDPVANSVCGATASLSPFSLFEVSFDFTGFFQPIDNLPIVNSAKAGSAVPVKFSLGGDRGLDVIAPGYPRAQLVQCSTGEAVDVIEETASAGGSGLQFDSSTGIYTFVWKTDKAWAKSCRELQVRFSDGETHTARFTFAK
jgi:hypothetical protein